MEVGLLLSYWCWFARCGRLCRLGVLSYSCHIGLILKAENVFGKLQEAYFEIQLDSSLRALAHHICYCGNECAKEKKELGFRTVCLLCDTLVGHPVHMAVR